MKVKAIEKKLKFTKDPNDPGVWRYVMQPEQYSSLTQKKVAIQITCYDRNGDEVKRVTSTSGDVEDNESNSPSGGGSTGGNTGGSTGGGGNGGGGNGDSDGDVI